MKFVGISMKMKKNFNNNFTKRYKNSIDPFIVKWAYDKFLGLATVD